MFVQILLFIINYFFSRNVQSIDLDAINVLSIKTEQNDTDIDIQNTILVKNEIDIKDEILTYPDSDEINEKYSTKK